MRRSFWSIGQRRRCLSTSCPAFEANIGLHDAGGHQQDRAWNGQHLAVRPGTSPQSASSGLTAAPWQWPRPLLPRPRTPDRQARPAGCGLSRRRYLRAPCRPLPVSRQAPQNPQADRLPELQGQPQVAGQPAVRSCPVWEPVTGFRRSAPRQSASDPGRKSRRQCQRTFWIHRQSGCSSRSVPLRHQSAARRTTPD